jgi:hypothetical protein
MLYLLLSIDLPSYHAHSTASDDLCLMDTWTHRHVRFQCPKRSKKLTDICASCESIIIYFMYVSMNRNGK